MLFMRHFYVKAVGFIHYDFLTMTFVFWGGDFGAFIVRDISLLAW